jgi:glycosyltransferase involved in cell wall biosynthesis
MRGPLVSVIVPVFNAEATLAETLRSALAQSYEAVEIIVVDDGSTDRTAEIAAGFPAVRLIRRANRGAAAARNAGIAASRGAWLAPLDADDLWHPAKLARQVAAALAAPEPPAFVYCWVRYIDGAGLVLGSAPRHSFEGRTIHRHLHTNFVGMGGQALFRRDAVEALGGYDESLERCEDVLLQYQLAARWPVALVPEYLVGHRRVAGQMSADRRAMLRGWRQVRRKLRETCPGVRHDYDCWTDARQYYLAAMADRASGRHAAAAGRMLQALARDPLWTMGQIRLALAQRRRRETGPGAGPRFLDADTMAPIGEAETSAWLSRLGARRLSRLGQLDAIRPGAGRV